MKKFFIALVILVFTFFIQGCQGDLEIQGSSSIYVNESQIYKAVAVSLNIEDADSYLWSIKSKKKDYTLTYDETSEVLFHAKSIGTYTLEVKVKKGNKTFKTELEIEVTEPEIIKGYTLPSEPDPTINDSTLLGIDVNNNGVRDDVERYVIKRYAQDPDFPKTKTALAMQYAWAEQKIIENPVIESSIYTDDALDCETYWLRKKVIGMTTLEGLHYFKKHEVFSDTAIKDKIYNTRKRVERNFEFNQACSGNIFDGRKAKLDYCHTNIDSLGE